MKYLSSLIKTSLKVLAKDNGWIKEGNYYNRFIKGHMQLGFCDHYVTFWTNTKDKWGQDVIKISYEEMKEDRMCAIVEALICNTE
tara:strand:+ start:7804 stop:8058 length:255 start_codon:yes stop_codon:yes gene_type:complete